MIFNNDVLFDKIILNFYSQLNLNDSNSSKPVPFLHGEPGVGKSAITKHITENILNWKFEDIRLGQIDSTDLKGFPFVTKAADSEGEIFDVAKWASPDFLPSKNDKKNMVLFFDEVNRASNDVLQAFFQLVGDRAVGSYSLPKNTVLIAAGNFGEKDGCFVNEIDKALKNRFTHIEVYPNVNRWLTWADGKINKYIIAYIKNRNSALYKNDINSEEFSFATPRTWEMLSMQIETAFNFKGTKSEEEILNYLSESGIFTETVGVLGIDFANFLTDIFRISVKDVLNGFDKVKIALLESPKSKIHFLLNELAEYFYKNQNYKQYEFESLIHFLKCKELVNDDELANFILTFLENMTDLKCFKFVNSLKNEFEDLSKKLISLGVKK